MTVPIEEYNSLCNTMKFLYELLDPSKTPKVPKEIRNKASMCLRHYPTILRISEMYDVDYSKIPHRY